MVGNNAALDMYRPIQRDPRHVDRSTYSTAPMERENADGLTARLLQFGAVKSLSLAGTNASADALDRLISSAEAGGVAHLTHLNLRDTHLSPIHLAKLLRVLKTRAPLLTLLDISDNSLGDSAVESLTVCIPAMLQSLHIAANSLSAAAVTQLLQSLIDAKPTALEQLNLSYNHFDQKTIDEQRAVAFPASLRVLDLSGNVCKRGIIEGLVKSLHGCSGWLEEVYLRHTFQGDAALSAFLRGVSSMPALRVMDLAECGLTYRSGKLLAQQLPMHSKLMVIRLSHNMLEVEGVMDMASGLERLCQLTTLELGSCHLGNCGTVAVVTTLLRSGAPVVHLDISDNDINNAGLCEVCTLLSRLTCPRLQRLIISKNPCTKGSQANLIEMLQGRQSACQVVVDGTPLEEVFSSTSLFEAAHTLLAD